MFIKNKILFNNSSFNIMVNIYHSGRLRLKYTNDKESHDITLNIKDIYIKYDEIFIDPAVIKNKLFHLLIKEKIIRDITGTILYNNIEVPICAVNFKKLKKFDRVGVKRFLSRRDKYEK